MIKTGSINTKVILLYDGIVRFAPGILTKFGTFLSNRIKHRAKRIIRKEKLVLGSLIFERIFTYDGTYNDMFDAILAFASDLPQTKSVKRTNKGIFYVETTNEIELVPTIFFKKISDTEKDGELERMSIKVFSYTKDIVELRAYLSKIEELFIKNRENQLGKQLYYFDEIPIEPIMTRNDANLEKLEIVADLSKSPLTMTFNMFPLHTNKSLDNIYGSSIVNAKKRVDFFLNNEKWYVDKGIPYTLGILLHGSPGCGRTSFIKALSKDTNRHIINLKLSKYTTIQQITNLFYSSRINVVRDGYNNVYDIPIEKRIIVMEDIDCLTDIVYDRKYTQSTILANQINLSVLLNLLDGVLETPGRIVIMTTNEHEKLDPALIRPGRIDISMEFKKCSSNDIIDIVQGITGAKVDKSKHPKIQNMVWTPAEVTKIIFENIHEDVDKLLARYTIMPVPLKEKPKQEVHVSKFIQPKIGFYEKFSAEYESVDGIYENPLELLINRDNDPVLLKIREDFQKNNCSDAK
jgi:hypothetical protein